MLFSILSTIALAAFASASTIGKRQSATTCGSNYYSSDQVSQAVQQGYYDYQQGSEPGGYPHTYNDYEGFTFPCSSPYQEFPILESGIYTGGSPGADRVVFNTQGAYCGTITHTGASGNNFVGCSGTS